MPIPDFQSFFKPLLEFTSDGLEHSMEEARERLRPVMHISAEDMEELLPSGTQLKYDNRVAWAKSYLLQARLIESTRRGCFKITQRGTELLNQKYEKIDNKILGQYAEFVEFHTPNKGTKDGDDVSQQQSETPEEVLQKEYLKIKNELAGDILNRIKNNSPRFFENLVVDLMISMGYGGSRVDAGKAIGQSGDEGVDGIIKEDRLGLDIIYLQAKRWEGTVGRPEIQRFVGALHGKRANKGVFITTGKFSSDAFDYVENIGPKVILIDGKMLANLMIDFNLGTTTSANYEIKRIDSDYFGEE